MADMYFPTLTFFSRLDTLMSAVEFNIFASLLTRLTQEEGASLIEGGKIGDKLPPRFYNLLNHHKVLVPDSPGVPRNMRQLLERDLDDDLIRSSH